MANSRASADIELEQLRRCNQLLISMLCHLISSGANGRATICEESLSNTGSLHISHHVGGRLVLTVGRTEPAAPQSPAGLTPVSALV